MKATYEGKCSGRHSEARFQRDPYNVLISEAREALKAITGCDYRLPSGIKHVYCMAVRRSSVCVWEVKWTSVRVTITGDGRTWRADINGRWEKKAEGGAPDGPINQQSRWVKRGFPPHVAPSRRAARQPSRQGDAS
jgi:hypothetical protein